MELDKISDNGTIECNMALPSPAYHDVSDISSDSDTQEPKQVGQSSTGLSIRGEPQSSTDILEDKSELSDEEEGAFRGMSALPVDNSIAKRALCTRCSRPQKVCLCPSLPAQPLNISTCLYIVQHPAEESRVLRTVPLLEACLPQNKCKVLIGRRFGEERYPELATVCRNPGTLILYPGVEAANLEEVSLAYVQHPFSLIIIDGTWSQAKDIFYKNALFRLPKQVQLKSTISSQYVIRTQPTNTCLSTLECAAIALSILEKNPEIQETILRPLQALCSFQLQHGAQIHHSKEHLLKSGMYDKPMPKNKRKLKRMELLVSNVKI
ncbi:tRNA-uridine aminocarboxypropyltransferase 2 isoform X2 [Bombina bombina]|nr:tRNA-uridine aminocarboxypropyltransferase 2 isoform X2 [Bombina bombina]XP_053557559.1 tRNA-uridine aminocarboxypropyltransferase 2 isoform X2 [Bombina bombina]